ncbi:hydrogenase 1 large subunit [Salmonella enterica]|nr:hydrogenase 1 large subunit [Salmonella enterica]
MSNQYQTQGYTVNDAGRRLIVDPITRIEGHMRCEVNIDEQNVITNAVSCGTMFRGLEIILQGRDPRDAWAFVERICGVCTGVHALASVYAIEDAIGIQVPDNANIIRNIMLATLWCHDHLVHFYQLAGMDWIDVLNALKADPRATSQLAQSLSAWPMSSPGYFFDVQNRLKKFVDGGQLGIFRNGYWGHPQYKLSPEANLMGFAHYLEALDFQREIVKIHTIFGGKNPHPNWIVGGMPCAINLDQSGAVVNGDFKNVMPVDLADPQQIQEFVDHAWYRYPDDRLGRHPFDGITDPWYNPGDVKGSDTHIQQLNEQERYSWIKAPRWRGHAMEVGPLARTLIAYHKGDAATIESVDRMMSALKLPLSGIQSTLGRILCRAHEAQWAVGKLQYFFDRLMTNLKNGDLATANTEKWEPASWPQHCRGIGFTEAPRGALGHWASIRDQKIELYQCVVPTTWNASPRDPKKQIGAYEAALMGTQMAIPDQPLEILRTLHSFDPCLACSTHVLGDDGSELIAVQVR